MRFSQCLLAAAVASALVGLGAVTPETPVSAARLVQAPLYKNPIALQLYSFRDSFKTNGVPATLAKVKAHGVHARRTGRHLRPDPRAVQGGTREGRPHRDLDAHRHQGAREPGRLGQAARRCEVLRREVHRQRLVPARGDVRRRGCGGRDQGLQCRGQERRSRRPAVLLSRPRLRVRARHHHAHAVRHDRWRRPTRRP